MDDPVPARQRPLRSDDTATVLDLLRAMDVAEAGKPITTRADVDRILPDDPTGLRRDSRAITDTGGVAGFAAMKPHDDRLRAWTAIGARPDAVESAVPVLLRWLRQRATEIAVERGWGSAVALMWQLPGGLAEPALRDHGWVDVRRYSHLCVRLDPHIAAPAPSPGVVVDTATTEAQARRLHAVIEAAVAGHWDHQPKSADRFLADQRAAPGYDPSLWFLVTEDGEPAAAVIARQQHGQGLIAWVGTHPRHRRHGLARLALSTAMAALSRAGCADAVLDADAGNTTGALELYESLGLRVDYQLVQWRLAVPLAAA